MSAPLRIIFAGTPEFSVAPLQTLIDSKHQVVAVYTQPDRPAGRGQKLTASPVKQLAEQHNLPVEQPVSLKTAEALEVLQAYQADLMVVVAYGLILPKSVLDNPTHGCLNIHASLLPRWRGAAPIQRAIESGDAETGVTIMQMDTGLDTGDMLVKHSTKISEQDTAQSLHNRLSQIGCDALMETLAQLENQTLQPEKQTEDLVTYAEKLSKAEAEVDWQTPAAEIQRRVQAFNPWPVAFTLFSGKPLRIWQSQVTDSQLSGQVGEVLEVNKQGMLVQTGTGTLLLKQVQPSGKKSMSAYDFAQSRQLLGQLLGE